MSNDGWLKRIVGGDATALTVNSAKYAIELLRSSNGDKNLSKKSQEWIETAEKQIANAGTKGVDVSEDVIDELSKKIPKAINERKMPVYMGGVWLISDIRLDKNSQELLRSCFMSGICGWNTERENEIQYEINEFVHKYIDPANLKDDVYICYKGISLNFSKKAQYCEDDIRRLAYILNEFLGKFYITSFIIF